MDKGPCDPSYRKSGSSRKADRTRAIPLPLLQSQSNARPRLPFEIFFPFPNASEASGLQTSLTLPPGALHCHNSGPVTTNHTLSL